MIHLSQVLFHLLKTNEEIKVEMRLFFHLKNISTRVLVCLSVGIQYIYSVCA